MGHVPCTHDGTDMPTCTPDLRHAHRLPQEVREACRHGGGLHGACLNAHGTWTGAGNEHGKMPCASPFRRIEELSSQKPAKSYEQSETKRDRRAAWVQPTHFRGSAMSLCAAPWPTWQCPAHLRVGWVMRSGSRLSNGVMGLRELLKHPLPSRYRAHQGDDPHGEPDRFSKYRPYYTIYTCIVSYESRRIQHKRNHRDPTTSPPATSKFSWLADRG